VAINPTSKYRSNSKLDWHSNDDALGLSASLISHYCRQALEVAAPSVNIRFGADASRSMEYKTFLDAREIEPETKLDFDLCIVGAGAAGITIAREFLNTNLRVCVLESGGLRVDAAVNRLSEIDDVGRLGRIASQAGGREAVEENADLNLEAAELLQQLRKISDAVHTGNPAPRLRQVSDTE
jgi:hypothetical protein